MNSMMIIGLDFDGVIVDHAANKIKAAQELGIALALSDTPSDLLKQKIAPDILKKIQKMIYEDPRFALTTNLIAGVESGLNYFKNNNLPYFIISRQKNPQTATQSLKNHGLWGGYFNQDNVFFVENDAAKNQKAGGLNIDVYIDDCPSVLLAMPLVKKRFLFDPLDVYPTSQDYRKVASWPLFIRSFNL